MRRQGRRKRRWLWSTAHGKSSLGRFTRHTSPNGGGRRKAGLANRT
ncbi:hypothetical protein DLM_4090 [Aquitalea magnusonii]|uniref:Uncharacterized protein n=1 Tax=Aquitalea magnusonii TaxID=332411 RepID=A0A3G9GJU1_9NEIS|nr:hypothetical protein DLM_4090 [Aquitalea magnusonii]